MCFCKPVWEGSLGKPVSHWISSLLLFLPCEIEAGDVPFSISQATAKIGQPASLAFGAIPAEQ